MTDDLYERYKEALRVGHVSVLRGSLNAAIDAYKTAAEIAPSRALPHTSLGGVLLRLGRLEEALVEYAAAVARAPRDEGALLGQAEALSAAGERSEAAAALDRVAEIQAESGRLPEAADTLRRAIEFHETPERAHRQSDLIRQIRLSAGDQAAEQLLARALRLRDEGVTPAHAAPSYAAPPVPTTASAGPKAAPEPEAAEVVAAAEGQVEERAGVPVEAAVEPEPETGEAPVSPQEFPAEPATEPEPEPEPASAGTTERSWDGWWGDETRKVEATEPEPEQEATEPEPEPQATGPEPARGIGPGPVPVAGADERDVFAMEPAGYRSEEPVVGVMAATAGHPEADAGPSGDELLIAAEAAESAGDAAELRSLLLATARAYAREGRFEAALDAAHRLLRSAPSDVETHLVLVELYMARDWNTLAAEKLELLGRLAALSGDEDTRLKVSSMAGHASSGRHVVGAARS
jgi:tetratricopeptide (TPR) repeat protein